MKGVVEIEFIVAVFVFITTMSFVTFIVINNIPAFHGVATGEILKSRSYQFSEMMFFDEGAPANWETLPFANVNRIGFSTGRRYFIDENKLAQLAAACQPLPSGAGYQAVKNRLGLDNAYDIVIEASYLDDTPVTGSAKKLCGPSVTTQTRLEFQFTKLGVLSANGKIIRLRFIIMR